MGSQMKEDTLLDHLKLVSRQLMVYLWNWSLKTMSLQTWTWIVDAAAGNIDTNAWLVQFIDLWPLNCITFPLYHNCTLWVTYEPSMTKIHPGLLEIFYLKDGCTIKFLIKFTASFRNVIPQRWLWILNNAQLMLLMTVSLKNFCYQLANSPNLANSDLKN